MIYYLFISSLLRIIQDPTQLSYAQKKKSLSLRILFSQFCRQSYVKTVRDPFVYVLMYIRSRLKKQHLILKDFLTGLWPLIYVKKIVFFLQCLWNNWDFMKDLNMLWYI